MFRLRHGRVRYGPESDVEYHTETFLPQCRELMVGCRAPVQVFANRDNPTDRAPRPSPFLVVLAILAIAKIIRAFHGSGRVGSGSGFHL